MYILYADESGSVSDPSQDFFILAGCSVFERQTHWLATRLDEIASRFDAPNPTQVELHGSPMRSGKGVWRGFPETDRINAICDCLELTQNRPRSQSLFASVIKKTSHPGVDPIKHTFTQLSSRFDQYLMRMHKNENPQRGIMVFDKTKYPSTELTIQSLTHRFRVSGHDWGKIRNFSEVPMFLDSSSSRLIQLADLIAYAVYRKYQHQDDKFFKIIAPRFDAVGPTIHGLHVWA